MPASNWDFHLPTRVRFGWGRAAEAAEALRAQGATRVFVMAGRSYLKHQGGAEALAARLAPAAVTLFAETEENPSIATVDTAARLCAQSGAQAVLAIGGGSVLDAAKVVALLQKNEGSVRDYLDGVRKITAKGLFTVAVPTTSGTGSEVTPFSVITNPEKQSKPAIACPENFPDLAIVDPELTLTMPQPVAASTGLDALTQVIEGFWSTRATDISRALAFRAIVTIWRNLERACQDKDHDAVAAMASASCIGGVQMAMVGNTAIHPLSYPITLDHGVRHGFACALFLPAFLRFNAPVLDSAFADLLGVLGFSRAEAFADALEALMQRLGAPTRLGAVGVTEAMLPAIAARGIGRSTPANPRPVEAAEIVTICRGIL
ncbi:Alcohol dehydrogenase [Rhodovastum atsumiense]|uniref:iron-containing alcohol dehydrogenase family protein n=1 Tax=Rhodovastum atsumiense TaxID=504468 RepID=UPI00139F2A34|nr:iron-containing alcohol dehydrogenase [Rhodovastum atsumiense]CAH2602062.1 Alcohol dehydrogenase [Rhodovastum atsumiense]